MAGNPAADTLPGRVVPHSVEAEMSLLGAMMLDADVAGDVIEIVDKQAFHEPRHQLIFDALVDLYRTGGRARAAVDTLIEAARLPFDQNTRRDMRLRAAQLATVELGDNSAAIDMYRSVLAQTPNDLEVIERLAHLLGLEDRVPELLTLRQIQLGLESDPDKKLILRLELAKLVGPASVVACQGVLLLRCRRRSRGIMPPAERPRRG